MVAALPARAIPNALDLECQMIETDAGSCSLVFPEDAASILSFRRFVQRAKSGQPMDRLKLFPPDHIEFFKQTVIRLIQAQELPPSAMEQFDSAFAPEMY